ncbi:hypothetical protein MMC07_006736 [Pseudocyphellaria aurata]|nr:hypothetical protein [Pseudocyphellaria aurata]
MVDIFSHGFLVIYWRLVFMASFSAAIPLQGSTDNDLAFDSNGFLGSSVDTSKVLAFNLDQNQESFSNLNSGVSGITSEDNSGATSDVSSGITFGISGINIPNISPGVPMTSNPNGDSTVFSLNDQDPSVPLDEKILISSSTAGGDNGIEDLVTPDSAIDPNTLIIAQNGGSSCAVPERRECPNPDNFLRRPKSRIDPQTLPGRDTAKKYWQKLLEQDDTFMNSFTHYPENMRSLCISYLDGTVRPLPVCCIARSRLYAITITGLEVTDQGNCVTYVPNRPRCTNPKHRFCCEYADDPTRALQRLIFIASFSAAIPLQGSTDNDLAFDSNGFLGSSIDTSKVLAFNWDQNQESSSNLNSGSGSGITSEVTYGTASDISPEITFGISGINIPEFNLGVPVTSNPKGDSTMLSLNDQGSSVPLDEKTLISSSIGSDNGIEELATPDSSTDPNPLIIAQNGGSSCAVPEPLACSNPENFLRRPRPRANYPTLPGKDVARRYLKRLLEQDDAFIKKITQYTTEMAKVCRSYEDATVRLLALCCVNAGEEMVLGYRGLNCIAIH